MLSWVEHEKNITSESGWISFIGFYEEMTIIIFSIIIKYAPYLFFWTTVISA